MKALPIDKKLKTSHSISMSVVQKILLKQIISFKKLVYTILILMFFGIFFQLLAPLTFKLLIDNVLENELLDQNSFIGMLFSMFQTKQSLGFAVVFLFFLSTVFTRIFLYFQSLVVKRLSKEVMYQFSQKAFENLEMLSMGFHRNQAIGDFMYRLSYNTSAMGEIVEDGVVPFLRSFLYLLITFLVLFLINAQLALYACIALPVLALATFILNKRVVHASKQSEYWNNAVFSFIQQAVTQLKIIQAYSQEEKELQDFTSKVQTSLRAQQKVTEFNLLLSLTVGIIIAVSYSFIIWAGIQAVFEGDLSAGLLVAFLLYLNNATHPLSTLIYSISVIRGAHIKIARLEDYFSEKSHVSDAGTITKLPDADIEFKNVSVLGNNDKTILSSVSFRIPKNSITALVGVSGSGKTTILSLVPRLLTEPNKGGVEIGAHKVEEYTLKTLRNDIAYVPQEILLFNRSVRDIISFGKNNATNQEIQNASRLAVADGLI